MALTNHQMQLIESVQKSDLYAAKKAALECVKEDTTQKNKPWCDRYEKLLSNTPTVLELPPNIKYKAHLEDVSETFIEARYYLSDREKELFEHIVKMNNVCEELAKLKINYQNTTLLYGPSGTGKTTFGRYVAYKMGLPFLYINFAELIESAMGKTAQNLSVLFHFVKENKCVFMIDEIDTISIRRNAATDGPGTELARITVTLMQELDKISNEHIIIAATNRMDMMDEALLRRFTTKHEVKIFTVDEKIEMIKQYLASLGMKDHIENITEYCERNERTPQSQVINALIEGFVIKTILEEKNPPKSDMAFI